MKAGHLTTITSNTRHKPIQRLNTPRNVPMKTRMSEKRHKSICSPTTFSDVLVTPVKIRSWSRIARQYPNLGPKFLQYPYLTSVFEKRTQQLNLDPDPIFNTVENKRLGFHYIIIKKPLVVHLSNFPPLVTFVLRPNGCHATLSYPSLSRHPGRISPANVLAVVNDLGFGNAAKSRKFREHALKH